MIAKAQIKEIQNIFKKEKIILAYIFGSQANNTANKNSDMDIAILLPQDTGKIDRFNLRLELINKLAKLLKMPIDLIILNDIRSLFFKFIITKEGKLIYSKSESEYLDFECKLMGEYFDFKPFLELQNKNYVQRSL